MITRTKTIVKPNNGTWEFNLGVWHEDHNRTIHNRNGYKTRHGALTAAGIRRHKLMKRKGTTENYGHDKRNKGTLGKGEF